MMMKDLWHQWAAINWVFIIPLLSYCSKFPMPCAFVAFYQESLGSLYNSFRNGHTYVPHYWHFVWGNEQKGEEQGTVVSLLVVSTNSKNTLYWLVEWNTFNSYDITVMIFFFLDNWQHTEFKQSLTYKPRIPAVICFRPFICCPGWSHLRIATYKYTEAHLMVFFWNWHLCSETSIFPGNRGGGY